MVTDSRDKSIGILAIIVAAVLWGTTGVSATFAPQVSSLAIGAAAMGIGGMLQACIAWKSIRLNFSKIWGNKGWLWLGAISIMIYPLAFYSAMHIAGVTVGTVISIGSAPIFSAIIERVLDRNQISVQWIIGAFIGIGGIILLCIAQSHYHAINVTSSSSFVLTGALLGLVAGFTYALYSWIARHLMQAHVSSKAAMGAIFGTGGLLLIPVLLLTGKPFLYSWSNMGVGIYMTVFPMFFGYICFGYGLARVQSSMATVITLLEPVVAAIFAALIIGERISVLGWAGTGCIFICLILVTFPIKFFEAYRLKI